MKKMKLDNLQTLRKEKKLSRRELSVLSGINPTTIQKLEQGFYKDIKLTTLTTLSKTLKVKVKDLFTESVAKDYRLK